MAVDVAFVVVVAAAVVAAVVVDVAVAVVAAAGHSKPSHGSAPARSSALMIKSRPTQAAYVNSVPRCAHGTRKAVVVVLVSVVSAASLAGEAFANEQLQLYVNW